MLVDFIKYRWVYICFPVEDGLVVIVQYFCIFFVVRGYSSMLVLVVLWVIGSMVALEALDEFKHDVPCALWVCLEVFSLTFFGKVQLPSSFGVSLFPLQIASCSLEVCMG